MTTDVPQPKPHCLPAGLLLACARGKACHGVDVQRVGGTPWKAYAGGTGVPPMRNAQMTIPFMIATGTNEMRTTAKARRVDV